jgi:hypothetical protein
MCPLYLGYLPVSFGWLFAFVFSLVCVRSCSLLPCIFYGWVPIPYFYFKGFSSFFSFFRTICVLENGRARLLFDCRVVHMHIGWPAPVTKLGSKSLMWSLSDRADMSQGCPCSSPLNHLFSTSKDLNPSAVRVPFCGWADIFVSMCTSLLVSIKVLVSLLKGPH